MSIQWKVMKTPLSSKWKCRLVNVDGALLLIKFTSNMWRSVYISTANERLEVPYDVTSVMPEDITAQDAIDHIIEKSVAF